MSDRDSFGYFTGIGVSSDQQREAGVYRTDNAAIALLKVARKTEMDSHARLNAQGIYVVRPELSKRARLLRFVAMMATVAIAYIGYTWYTTSLVAMPPYTLLLNKPSARGGVEQCYQAFARDYSGDLAKSTSLVPEWRLRPPGVYGSYRVRGPSCAMNNGGAIYAEVNAYNTRLLLIPAGGAGLVLLLIVAVIAIERRTKT